MSVGVYFLEEHLEEHSISYIHFLDREYPFEVSLDSAEEVGFEAVYLILVEIRGILG